MSSILLSFAIPFSDLELACVVLDRKEQELASFTRWDIYIREAATLLYNNDVFVVTFVCRVSLV